MRDPNVLEIRIDTTTLNYPLVRLLVDGRESLASRGTDEPNSPGGILTNGALLPVDPPLRIAFYGCGCGTFGCANVAGLVRREGDRVTWSDFRSLTGAYTHAMPLEGEGPDPYTCDDGDDDWYQDSELPLPDLSFDASQYLQAVRSAAADRTWVTRTQQTVHHLRRLRPDLGVFANPGEESIQISARGAGAGEYLDRLDLPSGSAEDLALRLVALLDSGLTLRRIGAERRWR